MALINGPYKAWQAWRLSNTISAGVNKLAAKAGEAGGISAIPAWQRRRSSQCEEEALIAESWRRRLFSHPQKQHGGNESCGNGWRKRPTEAAGAAAAMAKMSANGKKPYKRSSKRWRNNAGVIMAAISQQLAAKAAQCGGESSSAIGVSSWPARRSANLESWHLFRSWHRRNSHCESILSANKAAGGE